ncbi:neprilysin-1-like [Lineus longissimus]|uniref:neprilysin-1-like n=1 Tax=Lineus longissimus TaxID=88925 RepID=UPI002B4CBF89
MDGPVDYRDKGDGLPKGLDQDSGIGSGYDKVKNEKRCWKRRSSLEKKLIVFITLAAFLILVLIIAVIVIASTTNRQGDICYSEGCINAASRIINGIDRDVSPCDNFFKFACGQWNRNHRIPSEDSRTTSFGVLRKEVRAIVRASLEEPVYATDPLAVAKAKDLYKECLNGTQTEARGIAPLMDHLSYFGGWPVINKTWREEDFDLVDLMIKSRTQGVDTLFWTRVKLDEKQSDSHINTIGEAGLGMPSRDYYLNGRDDASLKSYEKYATAMAILLGADPSQANEEIEKMVDLEIELAKIKTRQEDERDLEKMYNKMTVKELREKYSEFDWGRYMTGVFAFANITSNDTDLVIVRKPAYLTAMFKLINYTPKRTVANYIVWRRVKGNMDRLPKEYKKPLSAYKKEITGSSGERARWEVCAGYTEKYLGGAVGRIFVQKKFDEKAKGLAEEMIENIRAAFNEFLDENDWMDDVTKKAAKEKAAVLLPRVAYPDFIMNDTALDEKYEDIVVITNKYFETNIAIKSVYAKNNIAEIQEKVDKSEWPFVHPSAVNAYYFPNSNQIMFPAGILQPPYFHLEYPKYLNYGGVGLMMGHEITHGFDDEGRQTDKDGNLVPWWTPSAVENFKKKAQCIIDQYSSYKVEEVNMTLNGINTQGENIADNGGLMEAFRAYRNYVSSRGSEEPRLPGVDLSGNQLFFVNFAQIRCSKERPESFLMAITNWRHSPNRYRVIGTVSNMPEFAAAFNCPVGSPMNPEKKCRVW